MVDAEGVTVRRETETARGSETRTSTPWLHVGVFLVAVLVVISRRPDAVMNPQFWAEDGALWYAQAHNLGWWSVLFQPETGYFLSLPRLTSSFAHLLHIAAAPLLVNYDTILF